MPIHHTFVSVLPDGSNPNQVQPSNWNDNHVFDIMVHEEIPAGIIDSTDGWDGNRTFTTQYLPVPLTSLKLFKNGLRLTQTIDFNIINVAGIGTIVYAAGRNPKIGDNHVADYTKA